VARVGEVTKDADLFAELRMIDELQDHPQPTTGRLVLEGPVYYAWFIVMRRREANRWLPRRRLGKPNPSGPENRVRNP
jgi:hypothetical protein